MPQIKTISHKKYKRMFAFGCSMTKYGWPTWADLLGHAIPEYYNYGKSGAGNQFIACAITEANLKYKFNSDDLIMVMWTSVSREDRYKNNYWHVGGNIYTSDMMDDDYIEKWADTRYYLLRDLNYIALTQGYLENLGVDYDMLAMSSLTQLQLKGSDANFKNGADILDAYSSVLSAVKPDMLKTEFRGTWPQVPIRMRGNDAMYDYHPTPSNHLSYLKKIYPSWKVPKGVRKMADDYKLKMARAEYIDELGWDKPELWRL
jgi:hypothetical protein